jgi:hypothetical protein
MSAAAQHRKNLAKLLQEASRRRHLWDAFADFVEMAALSVANTLPNLDWDDREKRYQAIQKRYEPDELELFPRMLAELVLGLEAEPHDMLGMVFGELDLGNAARGQFFTPYHVCKLMADLTVDERMTGIVQHRGFVTVQEPAVGAGAMVIAMSQAMREKGLNYQKALHVTAIDVDSRAVHMAYLQFSLLHIPAVVVLGNALTLEQRECWYTPAHAMGWWDSKLHRGYAFGTPAAAEAELVSNAEGFVQEAAPSPASPEPARPADIQLSLFGDQVAA